MTRAEKIESTRALVSVYMDGIDPIKTSIVDYKGRKVKMLLHPDKLVLISDDYERMYIMDPIKPYEHDKVRMGKVVMMDYLFIVDEIILLEVSPDKFLEMLTTAPASHPLMYLIYIDGQQVFKTMSGTKWTKARNEYLHERKMGTIKFNVMKMVDPEKKETLFLFNQQAPTV